MNYYLLLRTLLFQLDPETAHDWTQMLMRLPGAGLLARIAAFGIPNAPRRVMGVIFPIRSGLAAGLDKDGECIAIWRALGFRFVEVGTVTPRPQPGNPSRACFVCRAPRR